MRHGSPEVEGIDFPDEEARHADNHALAEAHEAEADAQYLEGLTAEEEAEERECLGHPCDGDGDFPHAAIGDVFYCDGRCRG